MKTENLTVSLITSVVVERDAISNNVRQHLEAIARFGRRNRLRLDLKLYTLSATVQDSRIVVAPDAASIALDSHFARSDVILYHFGIHYCLFDSIHLAPRTAKVIVHYHGITPPNLVPADKQETLLASYRQALNIHAADQVLVTSRYLMDELARMGIELERVRRMPPATSFVVGSKRARTSATTGPRLIYVGRFVPAKGVMDLLRAVKELLAEGEGRLHVDLIGSRTYSDEAYLQQLMSFVVHSGLQDVVRFHFDIPDRQLADNLAEANALVIPSYHEGFCVPVIEAMMSGCPVIASDAGALPDTCGGLGRTFPAADVQALKACLAEFCHAHQQGGVVTDAGFVAERLWRARAAEYAADFTHKRCEERLCEAIFEDLVPRSTQTQRALGEARRAALVDIRTARAQTLETAAFRERLSAALTVTPTASVAKRAEPGELAATTPTNPAENSAKAASSNGVTPGRQIPYPELIQQVRHLVHLTLPPRSTVLVVSKGDSNLLQFPDRVGWHFPQTEDGIYAGHYPADSVAAIMHLEVLRGKGAEFLVFPSTAEWWLTYYAEFRKYLDAHCPKVLHERACLIYQLAGQPIKDLVNGMSNGVATSLEPASPSAEIDATRTRIPSEEKPTPANGSRRMSRAEVNAD